MTHPTVDPLTELRTRQRQLDQDLHTATIAWHKAWAAAERLRPAYEAAVAKATLLSDEQRDLFLALRAVNARIEDETGRRG